MGELTPEREWSNEEVRRGLELFQKGTSIRKLATDIGVSRHQAARFLAKCREAFTPPEPAKIQPANAFRAGQLYPETPEALPPYTPPAAQDFETLKRTRQELKSKLDHAAQVGDRQGVATYSLAIARLNSTDDPGASDAAETSYDFAGVPDAVLWFMGIALPALRAQAPRDDGEHSPALSPEQASNWELIQRACVALHARAASPIKSGATIALKFQAP